MSAPGAAVALISAAVACCGRGARRAVWALTIVLICMKHRRERVLGSQRDLVYVFLLMVAFKVRGAVLCGVVEPPHRATLAPVALWRLYSWSGPDVPAEGALPPVRHASGGGSNSARQDLMAFATALACCRCCRLLLPQVDGQSDFPWQVVFLIPWVWLCGVLLLAVLVAVSLTCARGRARLKDLLMPVSALGLGVWGGEGGKGAPHGPTHASECPGVGWQPGSAAPAPRRITPSNQPPAGAPLTAPLKRSRVWRALCGPPARRLASCCCSSASAFRSLPFAATWWPTWTGTTASPCR